MQPACWYKFWSQLDKLLFGLCIPCDFRVQLRPCRKMYERQRYASATHIGRAIFWGHRQEDTVKNWESFNMFKRFYVLSMTSNFARWTWRMRFCLSNVFLHGLSCTQKWWECTIHESCASSCDQIYTYLLQPLRCYKIPHVQFHTIWLHLMME